MFGSFTEDETKSLLLKQSSGSGKKPDETGKVEKSVEAQGLRFGSLDVETGKTHSGANGQLSGKPVTADGPVTFQSLTPFKKDDKEKSVKAANDHLSGVTNSLKVNGSIENNVLNGQKADGSYGIDLTSLSLHQQEDSQTYPSSRTKFHVLDGGNQNGAVHVSPVFAPKEEVQKAPKEPVVAVREFLPRGLINSGNLCFLNATLQALLSCSPFVLLLHEIKDRNIPKVCLSYIIVLNVPLTNK